MAENELSDFRLAHVLDAYARVIDSTRAADRVAQGYMRARRYLGSQDRRVIGDMLYALLRARVRLLRAWKHTVGHSLALSHEPCAALVLWLRESRSMPLEEALAYTSEALKVANRARKREANQAMLCHSPELEDRLARIVGDSALQTPGWRVPKACHGRWAKQLGQAEADALIEALLTPAPVDLRVNIARAQVSHARQELVAGGIDCAATPYSPHGLRLHGRANVTATSAFKDGLIELQDEASQLVALAVAPQPGWRVLDACAGGGGKALHLAALLDATGKVEAHDRDPRRMEPLVQRASRAGAVNITTLSPEALARDPQPYHAVLIDAPCSGLGTLRRRPELLWRHGEDHTIQAYARIQRQILDDYAPLVAPNGLLVYAVCSMERAEGEAVIADFLALHTDFAPDMLAPVLESAGAPNAAGLAREHTLRLWPHRHGTDGFFIARLRRVR